MTIPSTLDFAVSQNWLSNLANVASVLTAAVAVAAWVRYLWGFHARRVRLENYLKAEKHGATRRRDGNGQRSLLHLMANAGMTDAEIFEAAFSSKRIKTIAKGGNDTPLATAILFEYASKDVP